jgi:hypothetical protein
MNESFENSPNQIVDTLKKLFEEVDLLFDSGLLFLQNGEVKNMEDFNKLLNLGVLLRKRNINLSDFIFNKLEVLNVCHGGLFTQICYNAFEHYHITDSPITSKTGKISAQFLGNWGRFGNQLIQYMLLIVLGLKMNFEIHYPKWIGNHLFNLSVPPSNQEFDMVDEMALNEIFREKLIRYEFDIGNTLIELDKMIDYRGYFKSLFKFKPIVDFTGELKTLGFNSDSSLAIHVRLSDFVDRQSESKIEKIKVWLSNNLENINVDNIWLLTDDLNCLSEFKEFKVRSLSECNKQYERLSFLYDWQLLQNSKYCIVNSSSTFSSTATFYHSKYQVIYSQKSNGEFVPFNW